MTTEVPQHVRPGRPTRAWRGFRRWRWTRPFWGGLLTVLAGVEIFGTTQMSLGGLTFQMGPTGFLSWLIPTILAACGLLMWFSPQQRMFYAIVGAMTAVFSLIAVNLGGFFIGMLLGMVGTALGFAWVPAKVAKVGVEPDSDEPLDDQPTVVNDIPQSEPETGLLTDILPQPRNPLREPAAVEPGQDGERTPPNPRHPGPLAVALVLLSVSAAGLLAVERSEPVQAAATCSPIGRPRTPASRPVPMSPALRLGDPTPTDSVDPTASASPSPTSSPTPTGGPAPTGEPRPTPTPCAPSTRPAPGKPDRPLPRGAVEPGQPPVAKVPSKLTGSKFTMHKMEFVGTVELPTIDGTLRALKFTMDKGVADDFKLRVAGRSGKTLLIEADRLTIDGDVAFYATRLAGRILGVKVTLTPDGSLPDGIPLTSAAPVTLDDPEIDLAFVTSDSLTARPTLKTSFV